MILRVMLAEDHPQVRAGLRALINSQVDMSVCAESADGQAAISCLMRDQPDVLLLDLSLPLKSGIEVARFAQATYPKIATLVLTMHDEEDYFYQVLEAGASGYLIKGSPPSDLLSAIRSVAQGGVVLHPTLARGLITRFHKQHLPTDASPTHEEHDCILSPREREVLELTAQGLTARETGESLGISPNTVERHRANIMGKLQISNRAQLVRFAMETGLVRKRP